MANSNKKEQVQRPNFPSRGLGRGMGRGLGLGRGMGRGPGYWGQCFRFPWLPRWWWMKSGPQTDLSDIVSRPTPKEEKEILTEELNVLREEMKAIEHRIKNL